MKMSKYDKPISEIKECPHCGSDYGYYQQIYVSGWVEYSKDFSGEANNAGELYDHIDYSRYSKFYNCCQCKKRLARVN